MVKKFSFFSEYGFTILELITSLAISSIVISSVYYFWNFLNTHVYTHAKHAQFEQDAHYAAQNVFSRLNKSSEIIEWGPQKITFVSSSGDTDNYIFDGDTLRYNNSAINFINTDLKVNSFNLRDINENMISESQHIFLEVSIVIVHNERDTIAIKKIIRSKQTVNGSQSLW